MQETMTEEWGLKFTGRRDLRFGQYLKGAT